MTTTPQATSTLACLLLILVGCTPRTPSPPLQRDAREPDEAATLLTEYEHVRSLINASQYGEAEPHVRHHLEKCLSTSTVDPETLARAHAILAHLCDATARPDEAEQNYRAALAIREKIDAENPYVVGTLLNLSSLLVDRGNPVEAETLLKKAARLAEVPDLPVDLKLNALSALARFLTDRSRYQEAEAVWRRIAEITGPRRAPNDPRHSEVLNNVAFVLEGQERLAEAIDGYNDALAACASDMGSESPEWLRIDMNLFSCRGKYARQIRSLTPNEAKQLVASWKGTLDLSGITELTPATAQVLSQHDGELRLDHLASLPADVATALAQHQHQLSLDGVVELSTATAKALAAHRTSLDAREDRATTQEMLASLGGSDLSLNGLIELPDDVAAALSAHRGSLALKGLRAITAQSAESLTKHDGTLDLRGLLDCPDEVKAILRTNNRIVLPSHASSTK